LEQVQTIAENVIRNVERVIVGKHREVELALIALICRGHVLIEDVPGVGKTVLAKAIAKSIGCSFKRIQFSPDLLPSDVTGVSVFNQKTGDFEYRPGPIMGQIVLVDEINRASPKTQSALLECMEERQVTVDGHTHLVPEPFIVLATQNPIEYEGTYPLPEAQLDRFLMRISLGYPSAEDEITILDRQQHLHPLEALDQVVDVAELVVLQHAIKEVYVDPLISKYVVGIVGATRSHADVYLGASPRGSLSLYRTSQARAALQGRDYVIPDDVKALAECTLSHRLIMSPSAQINNIDRKQIVAGVLAKVPVPGARVNRT
jgi:MoxR-like ATPase